MCRFFQEKLRLARAAILAIAALAAALAGASVITSMAMASASAKKPGITLHFFLANGSFKVTDPSGKPVDPRHQKVGDVTTQTDRLYVGDHHVMASKSTASDHYRCVNTSVPSTPSGQGKARCDGQIKIGSSTLLAKHAMTISSPAASYLPITGGSGKYSGYHGQAKFAGPHHSDLTIVVHR